MKNIMLAISLVALLSGNQMHGSAANQGDGKKDKEAPTSAQTNQNESDLAAVARWRLVGRVRVDNHSSFDLIYKNSLTGGIFRVPLSALLHPRASSAVTHPAHLLQSIEDGKEVLESQQYAQTVKTPRGYQSYICDDGCKHFEKKSAAGAAPSASGK